MDPSPLIRKATGEKELFSRTKLENSLKRVGADNVTTGKVIDEINNWLYDGISTKKIYKRAFELLRQYKRSTAARYKLKQAIMELGPTGYPFEKFIGQIIKSFGFEVEVGQIVQGQCIQHEVDVIATGNNKQIFVECKFYNSQGKHANVQVPLYIRSRVDDIIKKRQMFPQYNNFSFQGWIVTNTRFTSDAVDYGKCAGLHLIGWDYPQGHGLKDIIEEENFFPVTALTSVNMLQKKILMDNGIVLCRQILLNPGVLTRLEINPQKRNILVEEVNELCGSKKTTGPVSN
jgi:hypothetical protein